MFVCLCVYLFVPKDLANCWADRILLNRVASHRSREGLTIFSLQKSQQIEFFFTWTQLRKVMYYLSKKTFKVSLDASMGVAASNIMN